MATTIITKFGSGAPAASDVVRGELAVDTENKRLYTENSGGSVVELGTNPTTLAVDTDTLVVDAANDRVGIGTASPAYKLEVESSSDADLVQVQSTASANDTVLRLGISGNDAVITGSGGSSGNLNFKTYGSTRMYIDTTGNVGIGTTSPDEKLHVHASDSGNSLAAFTNSTTGTTTEFVVGINASEQAIIYNENNTDMLFATNDSEAMRIDSSGNVGIMKTPEATNSNYRSLEVGLANLMGRTGGTDWYLNSNAYYSDAWRYTTAASAAQYVQSNGEHFWKNATGTTAADGTVNNTGTWTEQMKLDSSGRLLVGGTSAFGADMATLDASGFIGIRRTSASGMEIRRDSTDGNLLDFQKDGTAVGSIGTANGDSITIGNSTGNLILYAATVAPASTSAGGASDGAVDLGASGRRFKDLYLAGRARAAGSTGSPAFASVTDTDTGMNPDGAGNIQFTTQGSEAARFDSSGNLLVRQTSAAVSDTHNGGSVEQFWGNQFSSSNSTNTKVMIGSGPNEGYVGASCLSSSGQYVINSYLRFDNTNATAGSDAGQILFFTQTGGTNAAERMRIDSSGNVGIGQTPGVRLHVEGATNSNVMIVNNIGTAPNYIFDVRDDGVSKLRVDPSGNLLLGQTSHTGPGNGNTTTGGGWENSGRFWASTASSDHGFNRNSTGVNISIRNSGTQIGYIFNNASSVTYNTTSDQRLKENIVDAPSASDDIDAIQVRSFDWKADGSHQKYGMVAQELVTVAPSAVSQPEDPEEMMGVDYSVLVPMLVKEIQSLRARVAQLEGAN